MLVHGVQSGDDGIAVDVRVSSRRHQLTDEGEIGSEMGQTTQLPILTFASFESAWPGKTFFTASLCAGVVFYRMIFVLVILIELG